MTILRSDNRKHSNSEENYFNDIQDTNLQTLCKKLLKSRLFSGCYKERHYVEPLQEYRDVVSLHNLEKDLAKVLRDVVDSLYKFYQQHHKQMWIGVSNGPVNSGISLLSRTPETYIWTELENLAFGDYWFSIKSLKFRYNEVIIKLKMVRPVDAQQLQQQYEITNSTRPSQNNMESSTIDDATNTLTKTISTTMTTAKMLNANIKLEDYILLVQQWWASLVAHIYFILYNGFNVNNVKMFVRFVGLTLISLITFGVEAIKFTGVYSLRLLHELNHFINATRPIIIKIIDVLSKIIGGIFILITMIWKDLMGYPQQIPVRRQLPQHYSTPSPKRLQ